MKDKKDATEGNKHKWLGVAGHYISSPIPGKSVTVEGFYICDKCGLKQNTWPLPEGPCSDSP